MVSHFYLLAASAGLLLATWLPSLQVMLAVSLAVVVAAVVLFYWRTNPGCTDKTNRYCTQTLPLCLLLLAGGVLWHANWANRHLGQQLDTLHEGQSLQVRGEIVSLPQTNTRRQRFHFRVSHEDGLLPGRLLLLSYYGEESLRAGQHWLFTVQLKRPHGMVNAAGFDYEAWLLQNGFAATGYVQDVASNKQLSRNSFSLAALRQSLRDLLTGHAGIENGAVISALVIGDRSQLSADNWALFSRTGTTHLFVISGLHVGLLSMVVLFIANRVLMLASSIFLLWPRQQFATVLALLAAAAYSALAGFSLPTQRALIMVAVFMLGRLTARPVPVSFRFCLALLLVLLNNPLAGLSAGFWLSFIAVGGLLAFAEKLLRTTLTPSWAGRLRRALAPQWIIFLLLSAPLALQTGFLTPLAPLVNTLAIPFVGAVVIPLVLLAALFLIAGLPLAKWTLHAADWSLSVLLDVLGWLAGTELLIPLPAPHLLAVLLALLASCLLLLPWRRVSLIAALCLSLPLWLPQREMLAAGEMQVDVLDVGQGLAVLVRTQKHALLFDTGAAQQEGFSIAEAVVLPVLARAGLPRLNKLVVSHADNDHAGGAPLVLAHMPTTPLLSGQSIAGLPGQLCQAGQHWQWDQVRFDILHPDGRDNRNNNNRSNNNASCVLRIEATNGSMLLPGDIDSHIERALVLRYGEALRSDVLVSAHHGSNTSSGYPFLKTVQPQRVVHSAGYRNGFGHPALAVQARYAALNIDQWSTAQTGAVRLRWRSGAGLQVESMRDLQRRYWRPSGNSD